MPAWARESHVWSPSLPAPLSGLYILTPAIAESGSNYLPCNSARNICRSHPTITRTDTHKSQWAISIPSQPDLETYLSLAHTACDVLTNVSTHPPSEGDGTEMTTRFSTAHDLFMETPRQLQTVQGPILCVGGMVYSLYGVPQRPALYRDASEHAPESRHRRRRSLESKLGKVAERKQQRQLWVPLQGVEAEHKQVAGHPRRGPAAVRLPPGPKKERL
ncbi:hypothetical protein V8E53_015304 [Lactarius tabidus]